MAAEVRKEVLELYFGSSPEAKQAADARLRELQESPLAWAVGQELLSDPDATVQFFGAQTLYNKVQRVAKGYEQLEGQQLLALVPVLQQHLRRPELTTQSRQRLVLALAAIAVQGCSGSWPSAVPELLALASELPQCAWCALLAIPEQLNSVVHTYLKTDRRTQALLTAAPALLAAALALGGGTAVEPATGTLTDSPFSLAMQTLTQWSKVLGMPLLEHRGFAEQLAALLRGPAGAAEPVLELLIEVLGSSSGAFALYAGSKGQKEAQAPPGLEGLLAAVVGMLGGMLPDVQRLANNPPTSLEESDASRLSLWARISSTLIEAYTQILWAEAAAADVVVGFVANCFLVHPHIAQSVFELWAVLKDSNRDGKLPAGVLSALLRRLGPACTLSLSRFGRWDSPHSEDPASLRQLREAQQDIVVDMLCIAAGTPEAPWLLSLLLELLQKAEAAKDWNGAEVVWYAFSGIAEALADEPTLPDAFQNVLQSIFRAEVQTPAQCETAAVLLQRCGPHFEKSLLPQLAPSVQWLVNQVPQIPQIASEAVEELCGYAGRHLVPHAAEFLKVVEQVAPGVSPAVNASLHGALVGIVRNLPTEQAVPAFVDICQTTSKQLHGPVDILQESGRQLLHRCLCVFLRCTLVMEQAGSSSSSAAGAKGGPTPERQAAGTCLAAVLNANWAQLAPPCQRLLCAAPVARDAPKGKPIFEFSDEALQVNILALLRYAARAACDAAAGGEQLAGQLLQLALGCCREGQLACLYALSVLAQSEPRARSHVVPVFGEICQKVFTHIQSGKADSDLIPFLELISALGANLGDELFQSAYVETLVRLCAMALVSAEADMLKPVLTFLLKLLMSRSSALTPQLVQEIVQAVLQHFHKWPRMLGTHILKVFSAMIERYEAIFLPLATSPGLPAVASLPPTERAIVQQAFRSLRGPRLRAFLGDLGAVARSENSVDVLHAYQE